MNSSMLLNVLKLKMSMSYIFIPRSRENTCPGAQNIFLFKPALELPVGLPQCASYHKSATKPG